jgi:hypothetical protein
MGFGSLVAERMRSQQRTTSTVCGSSTANDEMLRHEIEQNGRLAIAGQTPLCGNR